MSLNRAISFLGLESAPRVHKAGGGREEDENPPPNMDPVSALVHRGEKLLGLIDEVIEDSAAHRTVDTLQQARHPAYPTGSLGFEEEMDEDLDLLARLTMSDRGDSNTIPIPNSNLNPNPINLTLTL